MRTRSVNSFLDHSAGSNAAPVVRELMPSYGLSVPRALLSGEELLHQVGGLVRLDDQEEVPPAAHHVQTRLGKETGEYPRVDHGDDRVAVAGDHECRRLQPPDVWQA